MEKIWIALILAFVPVLSWSLSYYFSKKEGKLKFFKNHFTFYYADWLFVLFNFLFVFCTNLNILFIPVISVSIVLSILINRIWFKGGINKLEAHMYNWKTRELTKTGHIHFVFMFFQLALILFFIVFSIKNVSSIVSCLILILYFLSYPKSSKNLHKKFILSDILVCSFGILIVLVKLSLLLI